MSSKKRIWAPILRRSQVRWDGLTKKQVGCPPTTNRIRFALPDLQTTPETKMERLSAPTLMVQENRLEESGGLDNFCTGRDRRAEWNRSFFRREAPDGAATTILR